MMMMIKEMKTYDSSTDFLSIAHFLFCHRFVFPKKLDSDLIHNIYEIIV